MLGPGLPVCVPRVPRPLPVRSAGPAPSTAVWAASEETKTICYLMLEITPNPCCKAPCIKPPNIV